MIDLTANSVIDLTTQIPTTVTLQYIKRNNFFWRYLMKIVQIFFQLI